MLENREIDPAMAGELAKPRWGGATLYYGDFPNGAVHLWSGLHELDWNGQIFLPLGNMIGMSAIEETTDSGTTSLKVQVAGWENIPGYIPADNLGDYSGREAKIWQATVDHDLPALVGEPLLIFDGILDTDETSTVPPTPGTQEAGSKVLSLSIVREDHDLLRSRPWLQTHETQFVLHTPALGQSRDRFFEFAYGVANLNLSPQISI